MKGVSFCGGLFVSNLRSFGITLCMKDVKVVPKPASGDGTGGGGGYGL